MAPSRGRGAHCRRRKNCSARRSARPRAAHAIAARSPSGRMRKAERTGSCSLGGKVWSWLGETFPMLSRASAPKCWESKAGDLPDLGVTVWTLLTNQATLNTNIHIGYSPLKLLQYAVFKGPLETASLILHAWNEMRTRHGGKAVWILFRRGYQEGNETSESDLSTFVPVYRHICMLGIGA